MNNYQVFFLCGFTPPDQTRVIEFVDWLVSAMSLEDKLHLIARSVEDPVRLRPTVQGGWDRCRMKLRRMHVQDFSIVTTKGNTVGAELSLNFESVHTVLQYSPGWRDEEAPQPSKVTIPDGIKTLSFGLRRDIWAACGRSDLAAQITQHIESLFVDLGWIYGYAHAAARPVTGRYSLIGAETATQLRVVDFDYHHKIEQIYNLNLLSKELLEQLHDPRRLDAFDGVAIRYRLLSKNDATVGGVLYLLDYSRETIRAAAHALEPLVWDRGD